MVKTIGLVVRMRFTRVGHGQSNLTYLVEDAAGRLTGTRTSA
jgi:hypothetical protein